LNTLIAFFILCIPPILFGKRGVYIISSKLVTGNFLRMMNLIITSFINHDYLNGHRKGVLDY